MIAALTVSLERFVRLSREDWAAIEESKKGHMMKAHAHDPLVCEGDWPKSLRLMGPGWACRYRDFANLGRHLDAND